MTRLQMRAHSQLRPYDRVPDDAVLSRRRPPDGKVSRAMYELVGADWRWTDRLGWSDERWQAWADSVETWLLDCDDRRAGYFELQPEVDGDVRLALFGLAPGFYGRGLGGHMLTRAVERAWEIPGTARVWVSTLDLDSPAALANYLARGFEIVDRISGPDPAPRSVVG